MVVIDLAEWRERKFIERTVENIREYERGFEYCVVPDYEKMAGEFGIENILVGDVFITLQESEEKLEHVAIKFPETYSMEAILDWFRVFEVRFNEANDFVSRANRIVAGVRYKNVPILVIETGAKDIPYNSADFIEITEVYERFEMAIDETPEG